MTAKTINPEVPLKGYDEMEVNEVSEQLHFLTDREIEKLLEYEKGSQKRKDVLEIIERELALRKRHPAR